MDSLMSKQREKNTS